MLVYLIAGLSTGSIFALAGVGLVLTYKTSGIFNFAHGALASASAFLFYALNEQAHVPWPVAAIVCVLVAGPAFGLVLERIAARVAKVSLPLKVLATVGVLLTIEGTIELIYPPGDTRNVSQFLPTNVLHIFGTRVEAFRIIIFALGLGSAVVLSIFLRSSRTGTAMRAVVDRPELLDISGTSPARTRRFAWVIGASMASASGVLLAPLLTLDATTLTFLVVTAFGAAAIGRFTSLPLTYLGGLAIGVGQALLQKYFISVTDIRAGLSDSLPFLVLFVVLLVSPRFRESRAGVTQLVRRAPWRTPSSIQLVGAVVVLGVLVLAPTFAGIHLTDWTRTLAYVVLFLSLGLLVRTSGQVSLAHVSFMAIGVAGFSHLAVDRNWPWGLALLAAALIAAPVGALLAIPAIRFTGLYLALATLGFGILLQHMFYSQPAMFGSNGFGLTVPRPQLGWLDVSSDRDYYYFVLVLCVVIVGVMLLINMGRLGRLLTAMGDSPAGLTAAGTSINVSRVLVFALSASIAAVAGVLDAAAIGTVGPVGYEPLLSLQLFTLVLITIGGPPWFALGAAVGQVLLPAYISSSGYTVSYALTVVFGLSAIAWACIPESSRGLPDRGRQAVDALGRVLTPKLLARRLQPQHAVQPGHVVDSSGRRGGQLEADNVRVRFGGLQAVDGVSLSAPLGKITGLIGPNGAGKTTMFNVCSGIVDAQEGVISLAGHSIDRLGTAARARRGLGRTFQQMELFDSLSVRQNVALGYEASRAGWNPLSHLVGTREVKRRAAEQAEAAIALCGLTESADEFVGALSTGNRRLVELARCIVGPFNILLLDEPSSGLDRLETERFGEILVGLSRDNGVGILLVEHDMALVNSICDYVYVVDFGKPLFGGTVPEVRNSPLVRAAYLGDDLDDLDDAAVELGGAGRR